MAAPRCAVTAAVTAAAPAPGEACSRSSLGVVARWRTGPRSMAPSLPSAAERERMLAKIEPLSIHLVPTGALGALARASRAFPLAAGVALYEAGSERNTELYFVASGSLHVLRASPAGASGPRARYWRRSAARPTRFAAHAAAPRQPHAAPR